MKRRFTLVLFYSLVLTALLALAACGGGSGDDDGNGGDDGNGNGNAETPNANGDNGATPEPTETPTPRPIRTPTPVPSGDPVLLVVFEANEFFPSEEEMRALPQTSVTVDGTEYSGVSLATVGQQVQAPAGTTVSLEGISSTGNRYATARYALAEVGEDTILVFGEGGVLNLVSSSIERAQWMTAVNSVSFP